MNTIYIFSGLGVDKRVFENIDFGPLNVQFVDWIKPLKNEKISDYAIRISKIITVKDPIIIGLSFGGMMALEVSKILPVKKVILIASAKNKRELPLIYFIAEKLKIHRLISASLTKNQNLLSDWLFGIESKKDQNYFKKY